MLREKGVKSDSMVGIMVDRSLEMMVGIIGILKAGGAYMPIDPTYPVDRIVYMLKDSKTDILLTQSGNLDTLEFTGDVLDLTDESIYATDHSNLAETYSPNDLAYIIYTSGSTGKPKGVMIEHRNVVSLLFNDRFQFNFNENDVWTMFHSQCFDFSVWEMYGALLYGGKLIIIPKSIAQNPEEYLQVLRKEQVTVLNQTPSAFNNLSKFEMASGEQELKIRYIIFGGEALKPVMLKEWREKYTKTKLINMYGITETTVHVTFKEITEAEIESNISNIGKPISTLKTYVMDQHLQLLPIGVVGELCVSGAGVARGYLNRPELSAEKFVQNPYDSTEKLYRSGDLARILPNEELEYLGRIDRQVKIRGFRIELGEIEDQLLKHIAIKDVVVIDREDQNGEKYLSAYIVVNKAKSNQNGLTVSELRGFLAKQLPDYMIPPYFVMLDKLPLTSNGKVDRKGLPEPEGSINLDSEYVAPRNELEEKLVIIWSGILGVEKIGVYDNFFDLGGHSLKILSTMKQINQEFGTNYPISMLFLNPTIRMLANSMEKKKLCDELECVVQLKEGIGDKNIFFVHPLGGAIHWYKELAKYLDQEYNVFGIQAKGMMGDSNLPSSIDEMTAVYIEEIQKVQPEGPYIIGAYCAGAIPAFEIIRQLEEKKASVEKVILLDSHAVIKKNFIVLSIGALSRRFKKGRKIEGLDEIARRQKEVEANIQYTMQKYWPQNMIQTNLYLIKVDESHDKLISKKYWRHLTSGQVVEKYTSGDHFSFLEEPLVEKTAVRVMEILKEE